MMEVILLERVENLGQMGDVVRVRPGFARNYLLPQRKALRATKDNMSRFESQRAQLEAQNLKRRQEAEAVGAKLDGLSVVLLRQASEAGQLYGSVTARDISEAVTEAGFTVQKSQVVLNQPIKELGLHTIRLVLHPEVSVSVTANVAKSAEEAEAQVSGFSAERQEAEQAFTEQTKAEG
jgi:large subunit ribosomal protein L9